MWTERMTHAIERSSLLERVGRTLGSAFGRAVRPGRTKELLAGTWFGHPLHPTLTDVTIGAWGSALLLDLTGNRDTDAGAQRLVVAGLVAAVPTAASGWSELADIVDPKPRGVAALHALGNVAALSLYAGSYAARRCGARGAGRGLSAAGMAALAGSGFLGGHLAYRQGVGVNQTAILTGPAEWTPVADEADVPVGAIRRVRVDGIDLAVHRQEDRLLAIANRCSHRGGPLHLGRVTDTTVRCPWHRSVFSLEDGGVVRGPATAPQPAYDARINDGKIEVRARQ